MTHVVLVTMWWFMATAVPQHQSSGGMYSMNCPQERLMPAPSAIGPFPSEDSCIAAAHLAMPSNRDFWTLGQKAAFEHAKSAHDSSLAMYNDYVKRLIKTNKPDHRYKSASGIVWWFNQNAARSGMSTNTGYSWSCDENGLCTENADHLSGPEVPKIEPYPFLPSDTYTVNQPCAAVKGWYK